MAHRRCLTPMLLLPALLCAAVALPNAAADNTWAAQLQREADALMELAIRKPYGTGFSPLPAGDQEVVIDIRATAAAALALREVSEAIQTARHQKVAFEVCRLLSDAQQSNGRMPPQVRLGPRSAVPVADADETEARPAAVSALALLTVMARTREKTDPICITAGNVALWLLKQQGRNGAWITPAPTPGARPSIRLEHPGYRDTALAMALVAHRLENPAAERSLRTALALLLKMRVASSGGAPGLWLDAYQPDGNPVETRLEQRRLDLLGARHAMQLLLGAALLNGDRESAAALTQAAAALEPLRTDDRAWPRYVTLRGVPIITTQPVRPPGLFDDPDPPPLQAGGFGLDALLKTSTELSAVGRPRYLRMAEEHRPADVQIALLIAGLSDDLLTLSAPLTAAEAARAIDARRHDWRLLEAAPPADLPTRTRRLMLLVDRCRLESLRARTP